MAEIFAVALLIALLLLIVGMVNPRLVLRGKFRNRPTVGFIYGSGAIAALVALIIVLPPEPEKEITAEISTEPAAPPMPVLSPKDSLKKAIEDRDRSLTVSLVADDTTEEGYSILTVSYHPAASWSESSYIAGLAMQLLDVGQVAVGSGVSISSIVLQAKAPAVDKYGNTSIDEAFKLIINDGDYLRINWANIDSFQLLNLAEVTSTALGRSIAAQYCQDTQNFRENRAFCRAAVLRR